MVDFSKELEGLDRSGLKRMLHEVEGPQDRILRSGGREYLNFSSNNYLGLANHPELRRAAMQGLERYGVGSGAARLVNGSQSPAHRLEEKLAQFKNAEAALVFNSGYHANLGALSSLAGAGDAIFSDELNHASMIDGIRLSKAERIVYPHNDLSSLEEKMQVARKNLKADATLWIATETVFSMDGDLAPLKELAALAKQYDAWLYLDEAHATGIFGAKGAGLWEAEAPDFPSERLVQMGTLGKALGCFGAYIAATQTVSDFLLHKARSFVFTTALPPSILEAALCALHLVEKQPDLRRQLAQHLEQFEAMAQQKIPGWTSRVQSPIIPIPVGDPLKAVALSDWLREKGFWVQAIRPPTVPLGGSRLRVTLMATHRPSDLQQLVDALAAGMKMI